MLSLTINDFDKAIWVSSTNMRHLIKATVEINFNLIGVNLQVTQNMQQIGNLQNQINSNNNSISQNTQNLLELAKLLEQHISNQQKTNQLFLDALKNVADILADHEKRLIAGGL